jgi:pimeloyl-ACP methyl ester carboxylesterase
VPVRVVLELVEHGYRETLERLIRRTFFTPEFADACPERVAWLVDAFWAGRPSLEEYLKHVVARQAHQTAQRLRGIDRPCLVVVGDRDTHLGGTGSHVAQSEYLASHIPGARLEVLPGVAHGFFWEQPEASAALIREWVTRATQR